MQKTVIANSGSADRGKTTSIRAVYEALKSKYEEEFKSISYIDEYSDIRAIFEIRGILFGLESQGDPKSRMFKSLDVFFEKDCKIIICTCRSRGDTKDKVRSLRDSHGYRLIWAQNISCKSVAVELNKIYVNSIITIVDDIINDRY